MTNVWNLPPSLIISLLNRFCRPEDPLIEIMNPMEEGLFAWFTVNFLLDQFSKPVVDSYVTLDLGGGSTQIVFVPGQGPNSIEEILP